MTAEDEKKISEPIISQFDKESSPYYSTARYYILWNFLCINNPSVGLYLSPRKEYIIKISHQLKKGSDKKKEWLRSLHLKERALGVV